MGPLCLCKKRFHQLASIYFQHFKAQIWPNKYFFFRDISGQGFREINPDNLLRINFVIPVVASLLLCC